MLSLLENKIVDKLDQLEKPDENDKLNEIHSMLSLQIIDKY